MGFKRYKEPGEATAAEVMERLGWTLRGGFWEKDKDGDVRKLSAGFTARIWEEQGPRKLELMARNKENE